MARRVLTRRLLAQVTTRLAEIRADAAEARASAILHGLGLSDEMLRTPTKQLSGGWMMRVALACALFVKPHVLLLGACGWGACACACDA